MNEFKNIGIASIINLEMFSSEWKFQNSGDGKTNSMAVYPVPVDDFNTFQYLLFSVVSVLFDEELGLSLCQLLYMVALIWTQGYNMQMSKTSASFAFFTDEEMRFIFSEVPCSIFHCGLDFQWIIFLGDFQERPFMFAFYRICRLFITLKISSSRFSFQKTLAE